MKSGRIAVAAGGELFRGANGLSPDLGDLIVAPNGGEARPGRLSGIASTTAILSAAADLAVGTPHEKLLRGTRAMEHAVSLARAGDERIARVFKDAGHALGIAIANLITLFAPPKVILAGSALQAGDLLLASLRDAVQAATPETIADIAEIVVHEASDDIWARGGRGPHTARSLRRPLGHHGTGQEALERDQEKWNPVFL